MQQEPTVQRNPRVVFRQLNDGTGVLLHLDSSNYHGLDPTGALIWDLLDSPKTIDTLIAEVRSSVTDGPPTLADDVREFVANLNDRNLITARPVPAPSV